MLAITVFSSPSNGTYFDGVGRTEYLRFFSSVVVGDVAKVNEPSLSFSSSSSFIIVSVDEFSEDVDVIFDAFSSGFDEFVAAVFSLYFFRCRSSSALRSFDFLFLCFFLRSRSLFEFRLLGIFSLLLLCSLVSICATTLFSIFLVFVPNSKHRRVIIASFRLPQTQQIIIEMLLPPKQSDSRRVNMLSLYGGRCRLLSASMTAPKASSDLLMLELSMSRWPLLSVRLLFSEPAKSAMHILPRMHCLPSTTCSI
mmetsp:Transcript_47172/g.75583  ORF Transcript_47172/g.75583 Transcript_47172/m.75583 type:complete len:253 (-) Transcript_47172:779-1537(-)